jgi:hypothetical protein
VRYINYPRETQTWAPDVLVSGEVDLTLSFGPTNVLRIDAGASIVMLAVPAAPAGGGVWGWGRDGLGTGARGRGRGEGGARARRALMSTTRPPDVIELVKKINSPQ